MRRSIDCERGVHYVSEYKDCSYEELRKNLRNNLLDLDRLEKVSDKLSKLIIKNKDELIFNSYNLILDHLLDDTDELLVELTERFY